MELSRTFRIVCLVLALILAGVTAILIWFANTVRDYPAPPRIQAPLDRAPDRSVLITRATAPIIAIRDRLEEAVPRTLVRLDERIEECVPREEVRVAGLDLFKTPKLGCKLVGTITRGAITLGGSGRVLSARLTINADIEVQDLGDIIKREKVTAAANVTVLAQLSVDPNWRLKPNVDLAYTWKTKPGVQVMGQRITFAKSADKALAKSLSQLERQIEAEIRTIDLRGEVEKVWREAHTTLSINRENPPIWMRIDPKNLGAGSLSVNGQEIAAELMLEADLQLEVGAEPSSPTPTMLGANAGAPAEADSKSSTADSEPSSCQSTLSRNTSPWITVLIVVAGGAALSSRCNVRSRATSARSSSLRSTLTSRSARRTPIASSPKRLGAGSA